MWRWSRFAGRVIIACIVFSTYVEVILYKNCLNMKFNGILHVCGGDPAPHQFWLVRKEYSPRMWRWSLARFIDSSLKGCILHVCGGDPFNFVNYKSDETYSPRMWRWSYIYLVNFLGLHVFSTYVEVILIESVKTSFPSCILHVCGGDPVLTSLTAI